MIGNAPAPLTGSSLERLLERVAEQVRMLRLERKMSQQALASAADLDRAYLSSIENGKSNLTLGALLRLANALDADLDLLFNLPSRRV